MNKLILILITVVLMHSVSAVLIFSEDFESYDTLNSSWHTVDNGQAGGEWVCSDNSQGACSVTQGTCGVGTTLQEIVYDNGDKVLRSYSNCKVDFNNYRFNSIKRNWTQPVSIDDYSVAYDIKIVDIGTFSEAEQRTFTIAVMPEPAWNWAGGYTSASTVGGQNSTYVFNRMRTQNQITTKTPLTLGASKPQVSNCIVADGNWHRVTHNINWDGANYNQSDLYIDGVLCLTDTTSTAGGVVLGGTNSFTIENEASFDVYFDNIEFRRQEFINATTPIHQDEPTISYVKTDPSEFGLIPTDDVGKSLTNLGDVDGDGNIDILAGTEEINTSRGGFIILDFYDNGSLADYYLYHYGNFSSFGFNLSPADSWGEDLDNIGDWDGNGVDDFVISSKDYDHISPFYSGALYLVLMNSDYTIKNITELSAQTGLDNSSRSAYDYIGVSVTNLGDIDNDGVNDIGVGSQSGGKYRIIRLNSDFTDKDVKIIDDEDLGFGGLSLFGLASEGLGDIDGDTVEDVLIKGSSRLYLVTLNTDGTDDTATEYDGVNNFSFSCTGGSFAFGMGDNDMNNDSITDWLFGNPDAPCGDYVGVVMMNSDGTANYSLEIGTPAPINDDFGAGITSIGDLNDDGYQDIVVASGEVSDIYVYFLNITNLDLNLSPPNVTYECNDGTDNDADGFTDYPNDPSCSSTTDDDESPFDYVQCNNGIDDDGDGYTDYPDDPSCSSSTDTTETPRDDTPYEEEDCLVEEGCLLKDSVPYNDELNLHDWWGTIGSLRAVNIYGSNKIYFDTDSDTVRFNMSKNLTNPNIYDNVNSDADFYIDIGGVGILFDDTNYTFYWEHLDADGRLVNSIRFDISRVSSVSVDFVKVLMYNYNGSEYVQFGNTIYPAHDSGSRIQFFLTFDQILKTYDLEYIEYGEGVVTVTDLDWADVLASKIYTIRVRDSNSIDDSKVDVYWDDIGLYTDDISYDTVCNEWDLPYYLRESFNGYPLVCDWNTNLNIFFTGKYKLADTTSFYFQDIQFPDPIEDSKSRYATIKFDAEFDNIASGGSTTVRLYDNDDRFNFVTTYFLNALAWYYDNDGSGTIAQSNIPFNETFEYMIVIDLEDNNYNLYFNGTEVVTGGEFTESFYNVKNIGYIKIQSAYSDVEIDNLDIFASTSDGTELLPDDEVTPVVVNETTMCGIVYLDTPNCISDDDCDSGKCLPTNKCSRWSADYCAEKGMVYGNKCFLSGTLSCGLTGAGNVIIDNFFLFLIFLVIVMLVVYLTIMFRRG